MMFFRFILCICFSFQAIAGQAQLNEALPLDTVSIATIDQFKDASKNWAVLGAVMINRTTGDLDFSDGKNVLVFRDDKHTTIGNIKAFDHGNIDFEIQFMLAPGAKAAILFQGVYKIHLNDSWGEKNISYKDCGGISISDNISPTERNTKRVPLSNACHAPGLWQKLEVSFVAPAFNAQGAKIKNARFDKVILNGAVIHENIDLPVRGMEEKAIAPLVIVGMKGPVAFKNIAYLPVEDEQIKLQNMKYKYMDGKMNTFPDFASGKVIKTGSLDAISWQPKTTGEDFAFEYAGVMDVPATKKYHFQTVTLGGGRLMIDGKKIIEHSSGIDHEGNMNRKDIGAATVTLEKGLHPFSFTYYRNTWATVPILGVFVQGRGNYLQALHDEASYPAEDAVSRIMIKPAGETVMQRSFLLYQGKRKTHCISVGTPPGIHYSYDISNGSLLQIWKGSFADATGMWHVRGNQVLQPLGSPLLFNDQPQFVQAEQSLPWPDSLSNEAGSYQWRGYDLKAEGGPVFKYQIAGVNVADVFYPEENGKILTRKINVSGEKAASDVFFRAAKAKKIERLSNGEYYINEGEYFIRFNSSVQPTIRQTNEGEELVVLIKRGTDSEINYSIIW